mmetsp:Transcript_24715/g.34891  ORF Transcript_24715/g.34891 Transcript_24715/m.34891 type:complete len:200 (+) Transcript_24715:611-1210(+)
MLFSVWRRHACAAGGDSDTLRKWGCSLPGEEGGERGLCGHCVQRGRQLSVLLGSLERLLSVLRHRHAHALTDLAGGSHQRAALRQARQRAGDVQTSRLPNQLPMGVGQLECLFSGLWRRVAGQGRRRHCRSHRGRPVHAPAGPDRAVQRQPLQSRLCVGMGGVGYLLSALRRGHTHARAGAEEPCCVWRDLSACTAGAD